jgi:hypothetical protein
MWWHRGGTALAQGLGMTTGDAPMKNFLLVPLLFAAAFAMAACGEASTDDADAANNGGGKTDRNCVKGKPCGDSCIALDKECHIEGAKPVCEVHNASGNDVGENFVAGFSDPLAELVLKPGDSCPTTFAATLEKLRQIDVLGSCNEGGRAGVATMVVSERAQILDEPDGMRLVITRTCGSREQHELIFSVFAGPGQFDKRNAEAIAFDKEAGVFNYYSIEGGVWEWHGNSMDMIREDASSRCAACHTGGGLIMKELDSPWLHWEGHHDTPGAAELVDDNEDLGEKDDGIAMEGMVRDGNDAWATTRVARLVEEKDLKALLAPLFCSVEVNLDNGADFAGDDLNFLGADFFLDPKFRTFSSVTIDTDKYVAQMEANNQEVVDGSGSALTKDGEKLRDTIFAFPFPERAAADSVHVDELRNQGIIDRDFMLDVLGVDFTRPIFSDERCGLLEFVPEGVDLNPVAISEGFAANVEAAAPADGTAAAQFLDNLKDPADADKHAGAAEAFLAACKERPSADMTVDVMRVVSLRRNQARELPVFEFPETMPFDSLRVARSTRFDAVTCELKE